MICARTTGSSNVGDGGTLVERSGAPSSPSPSLSAPSPRPSPPLPFSDSKLIVCDGRS